MREYKMYMHIMIVSVSTWRDHIYNASNDRRHEPEQQFRSPATPPQDSLLTCVPELACQCNINLHRMRNLWIL